MVILLMELYYYLDCSTEGSLKYDLVCLGATLFELKFKKLVHSLDSPIPTIKYVMDTINKPKDILSELIIDCVSFTDDKLVHIDDLWKKYSSPAARACFPKESLVDINEIWQWK